ncbi:SDR family NAD(P)-dependent oxidoreductase [Paracoccus sp. SCSIO 75233]|uniref:SDR family NAD(P)-dependent oxidoreductase n=1 Tax=Paracoccus sp. SCSIO 75233 TaxID=3017782 RepID=UPI0022F0FBD3|nr:SDR family NAD(P)-dependent oxidoreductase [Paracoccus sp. SCSIO 75233]WBU52417.1 SDR family NAD(P)-dependent oxidoreductase [Paracoccus sp. SCSIO 75233]
MTQKDLRVGFADRQPSEIWYKIGTEVQDMARLDGKVAVVTGAAGGIGAAVVRRFVAEGAQVFLTDRDPVLLSALCEELGDRADFSVADISDETDVRAVFRGAEDRFGPIDIAVLNAGIVGKFGEIGALSASDFDQVMAVNVRGVFLGLSWLMPVMKARRSGSITVLSSTAGLRASTGLAPYVTSKHAVIGMMRAAAIEGAAYGVRVNTVNPGPIETEMMRKIERGRKSEAADLAYAATKGKIPMKRYGQPEEVAALITFLSSSEASYCSGNTYLVDGAAIAGTAS